MRLHIWLSANTQPVPFSYQHFLTGRFHGWVGQNEVHDSMSLYSLGWLQPVRTSGPGGSNRGPATALEFPEGARWSISAPDTPAGEELLRRVGGGAMVAPGVCCGTEVLQVRGQATPEFGERLVHRRGTRHG